MRIGGLKSSPLPIQLVTIVFLRLTIFWGCILSFSGKRQVENITPVHHFIV